MTYFIVWLKFLSQATFIIYMQLELPYAIETSTLEPSHKYVGWVVVDGEPLYEVSFAILYRLNQAPFPVFEIFTKKYF